MKTRKSASPLLWTLRHAAGPIASGHPLHPPSGAKTDSGLRPWLAKAAAGVLTIVGLFVYFMRPGPCDSIYEQTTLRLDTTLHFLNTNGEMVIGRDKIQDLAESSQRMGILCKTCCIAQQRGKINAAQFQDCLNTTKGYETQVLQVASSVEAAKARPPKRSGPSGQRED